MEIKEILKLHELLDQEGIEHEFIPRWKEFGCREDFTMFGIPSGYHIVVSDKDGSRIVSAIEGFGTYGVEADTIEIMGLVDCRTSMDSVEGGLTAKEIMKRLRTHGGYIVNGSIAVGNPATLTQLI